ncbi:MAG TPA: (2Fe-2S)-binding protein [Candidatus Saccharimonadales bacterium]|nr:(2Fe-2S)-binding protein [Candidatus Saccharimonadales bacterium]
MAKTISLTVNGKQYSGEAEPRMLLAHFLRDSLRLTGTHLGCVVGRCGACTVLWNGTPVKSCMVFAVQAEGDDIVTVEGLAQDQRLHPLQEAFWKNDAVECGYCTPGMLMSAYGLLSKGTKPTDEQIKKAISGNLCRCTGYGNIVAAIKEAAVNFTK